MKPILFFDYDLWRFDYPSMMDAVMDEYWEAIDFLDHDESECQRRLKSIIVRFPECHIDAYNHLSLSYRNQNNTYESRHHALIAYLIGKNCFPESFKVGKDVINWGFISNRPFLRACQILGMEFQSSGELERAIELYQENLSYNEGDNQGVRYLLLECYFQLMDYKNIKKLFKKYPDDQSVEFLYGKVIVDVLANKSKNVTVLIKEAWKHNAFVLDEIIKNRHVKPPLESIPGEPNLVIGIRPGSIQEAYYYWQSNKTVLSTDQIKKEALAIKKRMKDLKLM